MEASMKVNRIEDSDLQDIYFKSGPYIMKGTAKNVVIDMKENKLVVTWDNIPVIERVVEGR